MARPLVVLVALLLPAAPSSAQTPSIHTGPRGGFELTVGHAAFIDDAAVDHVVLGAAGRMYFSPRASVGPEVVFMRGPRTDRDLFVTGNLTLDLAGRYGQPPRVIPYVVVGAGVMRHSDRFGAQTFASSEGALTGGGGVRAWVTDRVFAGAEARLGWERTSASGRRSA